jgi:hypothetical protein
MICLDTNLLIHSHQRESNLHESAQAFVKKMAEASSPWTICYPSLVEFYGIVTKSSIWEEPTSPEEAFDQIHAWKESPTLRILNDTSSSLEVLQDLAISGRVTGPMIHDARIAACCLSNGVSLLYTIDRDFSRFPKLKARNPLIM